VLQRFRRTWQRAPRSLMRRRRMARRMVRLKFMARAIQPIGPARQVPCVSEACGRAVQVVGVGALDPDGDDLADAQRAAARDIDAAVDLGRVAPCCGPCDARPVSSMMTCWRVPTLRLRRLVEIACWRAISRSQRSALTSSGTGSGRAFDVAPLTGSYLKQPTRSICASSSQSSRSRTLLPSRRESRR
jgi:hypothetical protein